MKHAFARLSCMVLLTALALAAHAQTPQPELDALAKTVQVYVKGHPEPWLKHYEALQRQEMKFFGLSKYNKMWEFEGNIAVQSTGQKLLPYAVRYNPEYPGDKHHPVWATYDLSNCLGKAAGSVTMMDFDLVFLMDSTWHVKKVQPAIKMLEDGKSRDLGPNAIFDHVWDNCMSLQLTGMEQSQPALVGSRWGKIAAFLAQAEGRKTEINEAIAAAVRKHYKTAEVTEVMACEGPIEECFDVTAPLDGELQTDGIFKAASGPGMLYYHARIVVADQVSVTIDRVWK